MNTRIATGALGALVLAAALALTGCAGAAPTTDTAPATQAESVTIQDAWVKAADAGMTAAFAVMTNPTAEDITVVSATAPAAGMVELHETVPGDGGEMRMREVDGGLVVPAGGTLELAPGGSHIMLMDLLEPLRAGDETTLALAFADGSTIELTAVIKEFAGANETYEGGSGTGMGH